MAGISQRMVRNIREGLFDKMQRLPLAFYDTRPHGDIMSRLTNDVDAVSVTVSQSAVQLMSGVVVVCGTAAIMFSLSPVMAVVTPAPGPAGVPPHLHDCAAHAPALQGAAGRPGRAERAHRGDRVRHAGGEGVRAGSPRRASASPLINEELRAVRNTGPDLGGLPHADDERHQQHRLRARGGDRRLPCGARLHHRRSHRHVRRPTRASSCGR